MNLILIKQSFDSPYIHEQNCGSLCQYGAYYWDCEVVVCLELS